VENIIVHPKSTIVKSFVTQASGIFSLIYFEIITVAALNKVQQSLFNGIQYNDTQHNYFQHNIQ
jgi:hypothetical protein